MERPKRLQRQRLARAHRQRRAAQAIASVMGKTLLLAWTGESFMLSGEPIWVQPIAVALSVKSGEIADG